MKILSVTPENGRVIELTQDEYFEIKNLIEAVEGKTIDEVRYKSYPLREITDKEAGMMLASPEIFAGVLGAIRAFYLARFRINDMQQYINQMKDILDLQIKDKKKA
jgi:hypothetical protein